MQLIVFLGRPGSGKTTLSRAIAPALGATYLRIDTIEDGLRASHARPPDIMDAGYTIAEAMAKEALALNYSVVADAVFGEGFLRTPWQTMAEVFDIPVTWVEVTCSDLAEHQARIEARHTSGRRYGTDWAKVVARRCDPRPDPGFTIDTAGRTTDDCTAEILSALG